MKKPLIMLDLNESSRYGGPYVVANRIANSGLKKDFDFLRPCPQDSFAPYQAEKLIGKVLNIDLEKGSPLLASHFNNV